ncbi:Endophilin-A1 [Taenia crassiceps]|uniref:Endophilin-A1 n=1 Tax=Taenia crassiceps TaxID=6207 RepID=A0ABR4QN74_9CEST
MNKLRSKLRFNKETGSGSKANDATDTNCFFSELNVCKKFFAQWESKTLSLLRPGHHFHSQAQLSSIKGRSMKQDNYNYKEKSFVSYLNDFSDHLSGHLREAIQAMATTYQQVADLKSQRDSNMRTEVFNPIKDTTLKELDNIQKLRKAVENAQRELTEAVKSREKDSNQQATDRHDRAFRDHAVATERLKKAVIEFRQDEPKRITFLQASAEAQLEYHKWAMEAFTKLVSELRTIRGNSADSVPEMACNTNINGGGGYYEKPQASFAFTTTVERKASSVPDDSKFGPPSTTVAVTKCQALYDFEAEQNDDLSLKKGDIATIIEKVDDQWYYGEKDGRHGHFPVEFVQVI